ncbi:hypothetical protein DESME_00495 [Desulfitobacterium metallireducens DSM 15288]|uniref:Uncharacterized protein n=1 Tax=Desulfitobacterium metallireducens DSM 15288 TaxID=871968 RepID=W0EH19_9FIRM|nr:hypothetical protein DESME_00495 [Desulfitobacterium metallireducens DSM 15288]
MLEKIHLDVKSLIFILVMLIISVGSIIAVAK